MELETASSLMDALGHPLRLKIVHVVAKSGDEGIAVGALASRLGVPNATLSHHLAKLVESAVVRQDRRGNTLVCTVETKVVMALSAFLLQTGA